MYASCNGVRPLSFSSSPTDHKWNRLKRKTQDLDDDCRSIEILDTIVIDDKNFVDEDSNSTSLFRISKTCKTLSLIFFESDHLFDILYGDDFNNGSVTDFTVDLNDLDAVSKGFNSSINNVMPSSEVVQPRITF